MRISCPRAAVHQGIIKIVDDPLCLSAKIPELDGGEEFPVDIKDIVLAQCVIEFQFIQSILFIKMHGHVQPLLSKVRQILEYPVAATVHLQTMDQESDLQSSNPFEPR
jgi:hypothetical protein